MQLSDQEDPEGGKWNSERSVPPKDAPRAADGRGESIEGREGRAVEERPRSSRVLTLAVVPIGAKCHRVS